MKAIAPNTPQRSQLIKNLSSIYSLTANPQSMSDCLKNGKEVGWDEQMED